LSKPLGTIRRFLILCPRHNKHNALDKQPFSSLIIGYNVLRVLLRKEVGVKNKQKKKKKELISNKKHPKKES
jgi:hypothetical protein